MSSGSPQSDSTLTLQLTYEDVLQALRNWSNLAANEPKFSTLYLVRRQVRETPQLLRLAINAVLEEGLTHLSKSIPSDAELLKQRFCRQEQVDEVALKNNISVSRFHKWQKTAVDNLVLILNHLEETAWQRHKQNLLSRLDATTNRNLVGIDKHLELLLSLLDSKSSQGIISIEGIGGIGKTSLADAVVRRCIEARLFDDVAWVTARQERLNAGGIIVPHSGATHSVMELLEGLAEQLIPQSFHEYTLSYDRLLTLLGGQLNHWPHLIVIDNLESVVDLEKLVPTLNQLAIPSKFLLTSRMSFSDTDSIFQFRMPELSPDDALLFIHSEIQNRNLTTLADWDNENLNAITSITGGNPLAIRLMVGQAHMIDLPQVLSQLGENDGRPASNLFTYIYQQNWNSLGEAERRLLLVMALVNPNGDDFAALAAISGFDDNTVEKAIKQLSHISIIDVTGDGEHHFYRIHSLTRTFLQEIILHSTNQEGESTPYQRYFAEALVRGLSFVEQQLKNEDTDALLDMTVRDRALNVLSHALQHPALWTETVTVLQIMIPKMERSGQRDQWSPYLEQGIELGKQAGDVLSEGVLALALGELHRLRNNYEPARQWLKRSIECFSLHDEQQGKARALNQLAYLAWRQHHHEEIIQYATEALALVAPSSLERAMSLSALGLAALDRWQWKEAERYHQEALEIRQAHNNQRQVAWSLQNVACALRGQQQHERAISHYKQAIDLLESVRDPLNGAVAKMNLGIVYSVQGKSTEALQSYSEAESTIRNIGDNFNLSKVYVNQGIEYLTIRDFAQAEAAFEAGRRLSQSLNNHDEYLNATDGLGMTYLEQERYEEAEALFAEVLAGLPQINPNSAFYHMLLPEKIEEQLNEVQRRREAAVTT